MNKGEVVCLLLYTRNKTLGRIHPQLNFLKYTANVHNVSLRSFVECIRRHVSFNVAALESSIKLVYMCS